MAAFTKDPIFTKVISTTFAKVIFTIVFFISTFTMTTSEFTMEE